MHPLELPLGRTQHVSPPLDLRRVKHGPSQNMFYHSKQPALSAHRTKD
jgi:hypothetical protein